MKRIQVIIVIVLASLQFGANAQEKKIKFSSGTLKICSSKNFKIKGYDGTEVIIKSLHEKRNSYSLSANLAQGYARNAKVKGVSVGSSYTRSFPRRKGDTTAPKLLFTYSDTKRRVGLKRLGKKQENVDLGIYFTIEKKNGELIFKDETTGQFVMYSGESYEIMIPNTIKLNWDTNGCRESSSQRRTGRFFYSSNASSLSDFKGEVEISTSLNNMKLKDLTGPVSINSIGGNVTIEFDKKKPMKLYSIYSNNGFIDITLPSDSDISVDAQGAAIYSDIDFNVLSDTEERNKQKMRLKLKNGRTKMKLDAGLGNIYLRKK
ncbi:hypothetical protein RQM59_07220 [Flavobacteriaceae bacterium S356]|uniref:Adhesin domain-containing protein n=1 Tax=Asprobacillus argus TaxID=3076534 RepID=A0ABU3LEM5_9FLAO|nr:hypothetical protein [Flavobacteriaceae bacterium S356]